MATLNDVSTGRFCTVLGIIVYFVSVAMTTVDADCDFAACPARCTCSHRVSFTTPIVTVDCTATSLTSLPSSLPNCNDNATLFHLRFSNNTLAALPMRSYLPKVRELDLSFNQLNSLEASVFAQAQLSSLRTLSFEGNALTSLPETAKGVLDKLNTVNIQNNPWICDCKLAWLQDWVNNNANKLQGSINDIKCHAPLGFENIPLIRVRKSRLCPDDSGGAGIPAYAWWLIASILAYLTFGSIGALCLTMRRRVKIEVVTPDDIPYTMDSDNTPV
jgi:hypothetical protein